MKSASEIMNNRKKVKTAYRQLFESSDGRIVLDDLADEAGDGRDIFSPNANKTNYAVGKRALLVYIKKMMKEE